MDKILFEGFEDEIASIPVSDEEADMLIDTTQTIADEEAVASVEIPVIGDLLNKALDMYVYANQLISDNNIDENTKSILTSVNEDLATILGKLQQNLKQQDETGNIELGEDEASDLIDETEESDK